MALRARKRGFDPIQPGEGALDLGALVDLARGGDVDAFRELVERFGERVYRYAHARLWNPEDARDAQQDVFLAAWKGLPSFRTAHEGSFPAWLFGIARRVVAEYRRRNLRHGTTSLEDTPDAAVEFEGVVVSRRTVVDALARLSDTQREVIVLRFIVGLPAREVAVTLGKSESAVAATQLRALGKLRRALEEAR